MPLFATTIYNWLVSPHLSILQIPLNRKIQKAYTRSWLTQNPCKLKNSFQMEYITTLIGNVINK